MKNKSILSRLLWYFLPIALVLFGGAAFVIAWISRDASLSLLTLSPNPRKQRMVSEERSKRTRKVGRSR